MSMPIIDAMEVLDRDRPDDWFESTAAAYDQAFDYLAVTIAPLLDGSGWGYFEVV